MKQTPLQPQTFVKPKGNRAINRLLRKAHCERCAFNEELSDLHRSIESGSGRNNSADEADPFRLGCVDKTTS